MSLDALEAGALRESESRPCLVLSSQPKRIASRLRGMVLFGILVLAGCGGDGTTSHSVGDASDAADDSSGDAAPEDTADDLESGDVAEPDAVDAEPDPEIDASDTRDVVDDADADEPDADTLLDAPDADTDTSEDAGGDVPDVDRDPSDTPPDAEPDTVDTAPDIADVTPDLADATPDATDTAPDTRDTAPDVTDTAPDVTDTAPDAPDAAPDLPDTAPDADVAPDALPDVPDAEPDADVAPDVEPDTPVDVVPDVEPDAEDTGADLPPTCGDGVTEGGEACDDGNTVDEGPCDYGTPSCVGCSADCSAVLELDGPFCGDGLVQPEFEGCDGEPVFGCDSLGLVGDTSCGACTMVTSACRPSVCGDGVAEGDEECDDGGTSDGDGCSEGCELEGVRYDGWVAYVAAIGTALDRVQVVAGDNSDGPYTLPADGRFSIARQPSFSPDGTQIYYALARAGSPVIRVFNLDDGSFHDAVDSGFTAVRFPQVSPDGLTLLFSAKTADTSLVWNIFSVPLDGSSPPTPLTTVLDTERTTRFVNAGAWSCDGSQIFYLGGRPGDAGAGDAGSSNLWRMEADGSSPTRLTTDLFGTSIVPAVRNDCTEVMVDRLVGSVPTRIDLAALTLTEFGLASSDSNCAYYGDSDFAVCERESGPLPLFEPCTVGGVECVRDIVVIHIETGIELRNLTRSIGTRETLPAVSSQPFGDLPLTPPAEE